MIRDKLELNSIWSLSQAVNLATKVEMQLTRNHRAMTNRKQDWDIAKLSGNLGEAVKTNSGKLAVHEAMPNAAPTGNDFKSAPKPVNLYAKPSTIKSFRCWQQGHKSNECPTRK